MLSTGDEMSPYDRHTLKVRQRISQRTFYSPLLCFTSLRSIVQIYMFTPSSRSSQPFQRLFPVFDPSLSLSHPFFDHLVSHRTVSSAAECILRRHFVVLSFVTTDVVAI